MEYPDGYRHGKHEGLVGAIIQKILYERAKQ